MAFLSNASIRTKFYVFTGIAGFFLIAVGGTGFWATERQTAALQEVVITATALRNHVQADKMHDALRADVLAALEAANESDAAAVEEVQAALQEHVASFKESIDQNSQLALNEEVKAALAALAPKLDAYIEQANRILDQAALSAGLAQSRFPGFSASFEALETALDETSDRIEASARSATASAGHMAGISAIAILTVAFGGILLLGLVTSMLVRNIVRPIAAMTSVMQTLAAGDKTIRIPATGRGDEIGAMAQAVRVFRDSMIKADELAAAQEREHAAKEARASRIEAHMQSFDRAVTGILKTVAAASTELDSTASSMSATAEETNRQAMAVATAAEQASTNVETVANAAEELSSSIAEISRQVTRSTDIAGKAVAEANRTNVTVKGLAEAAQKIGAVVKLINEIASQTNLLALNATIEAARAGEAGRGFAVVASEVKSLANQTARATEEIGAQIGAMQSVTGEAVTAIAGIGAVIGQIDEIATTIASAVEEQGAATQQIARNVQQAAAGTQEVSTNITGVTRASSETGEAANQVLAASAEFLQQSDALKRQVEAFLAEVRAA